MKKKKFLIGSRGSRLALFQAEKVRDKLQKLFPHLAFEGVVIKTSGDQFSENSKGPTVGLIRTTEQGIFTKEIDQALLGGRIDMAVHSAKDLPTELLPSLRLGAILERDEVRDAWISRAGVPFEELPEGALIATSSPRRRAQLLRRHPDIEIKEIRGNVPTRLTKVKKGFADGLILAACGLIRLGLEKEITEILDKKVMLPAVSQGAIVVEVRKGDEVSLELANSLHHEESFLRVEAERSLLKSLRGGCQVPVGAFSRVEGPTLFLEAALFSLDGKRSVRGEVYGDRKDADRLGKELADRLIREGGTAILEEVRKSDPVKIPAH